METIIGLLMVLLPVILKLIGKRLERAGQQPEAHDDVPGEDWTEMVRRHLEQQGVALELVESESVESEPVQIIAEPEPVVREPVASRNSVRKSEKTTVKRSSPVLQAEDGKKREKIDPKKLIVYSEIMTPKYMD